VPAVNMGACAVAACAALLPCGALVVATVPAPVALVACGAVRLVACALFFVLVVAIVYILTWFVA